MYFDCILAKFNDRSILSEMCETSKMDGFYLFIGTFERMILDFSLNPIDVVSNCILPTHFCCKEFFVRIHVL